MAHRWNKWMPPGSSLPSWQEFHQNMQPGAAGYRAVQDTVDHLKEEGNTALRDNKIAVAITKYREGIELALTIPENFRQLAVLYSNMSYVNLRIDSVQRAIDDANEAIDADPTWHKGFFRLAKAQEAMGDTVLAQAALLRGVQEATLSDPQLSDLLRQMAIYACRNAECHSILSEVDDVKQVVWVRAIVLLQKEQQWNAIRVLVLGSDHYPGVLDAAGKHLQEMLPVYPIISQCSPDELQRWGEKLVVALLREGMPADKLRWNTGSPPMHTALKLGQIARGKFEALKVLVEKQDRSIKQLRNEQDEQGNTALHAACQSCPVNDSIAVDVLITLQVSPDIRNKRGQTALQLLSPKSKAYVSLQRYMNVSQDPVGEARNLKAKALAAFTIRNCAAAIPFYTEAIDLLKNSKSEEKRLLAELYLGRSLCHQHCGYMDKAQKDALRCSKSDDSLYKGHLQLARVAREEKAVVIEAYKAAFQTCLTETNREDIMKQIIEEMTPLIVQIQDRTVVSKAWNHIQAPKKVWESIISEWARSVQTALIAGVKDLRQVSACRFPNLDYSSFLRLTFTQWRAHGEKAVIYFIDHGAPLCFLILRPETFTPLQTAVLMGVQTGTIGLLDCLLKRHVTTREKINEQDEEGWTAFHLWANIQHRFSLYNSRQVLDRLLAVDILDVSLRANNGLLPLDLISTADRARTQMIPLIYRRMVEGETGTRQKSASGSRGSGRAPTTSALGQESTVEIDHDIPKECRECKKNIAYASITENPSSDRLSRLCAFLIRSHKSNYHKKLHGQAQDLMVDALPSEPKSELPMCLFELGVATVKILVSTTYQEEMYDKLHIILAQYATKVLGEKFQWTVFSRVKSCLAALEFNDDNNNKDTKGGKMSQNSVRPKLKSATDDLTQELDIAKFISSNYSQDDHERRYSFMEYMLLFQSSPAGLKEPLPAEVAHRRDDYKALNCLLRFGLNPALILSVADEPPYHAALYVALHRDKGNFLLLETLLCIQQKFPGLHACLDPTTIDQNGNTAFHQAASEQYSKHSRRAVELFCEHKFNPNLRNNKNMTVMDCLPKGAKEDRRLPFIKNASQNFLVEEVGTVPTRGGRNASGMQEPSKGKSKTSARNESGPSAPPADGVTVSTMGSEREKPKKPGKSSQQKSGTLAMLVQEIELVIERLEDGNMEDLWSSDEEDNDQDNKDVESEEEYEYTLPKPARQKEKAIEPAAPAVAASVSGGAPGGAGAPDGASAPCGAPQGVPRPAPASQSESSESEESDEAMSENEEEQEEIQELEDAPSIFDGLEWEVECTADVWKILKDRHLMLAMKRRIVNKILALASGDWTPGLTVPLRHTPEHMKLYKARISRGDCIIWELAVAFSPRKSDTPEAYYKPEAEGNTSDTFGQIYSEIIRVWDIVMKGNSIKHSIEKIKQSFNRGQECILQRNLQGFEQEEYQSGVTNVQKRVPRNFVEITTEGKKQLQLLKKRFFPPASPNNTEYHIMKFYSFNSTLVSHILLNQDIKVDFPFKVTEVEHVIINLQPKPPAPVILLGRSGTGKTTCCLYRLWSAFVRYWEQAQSAEGPLIPRAAAYLHTTPQITADTEENEMDDAEEDTEESEQEEENMEETAKNEDADEENEENKEPECLFDHLHQIFVTKNGVLCSEVRRNFISLRHACKANKGGADQDEPELPQKLQSVEHTAFPLFLTSRQLLLLLDASIPEPYFFQRKEDGTLEKQVEGWGTDDGSLAFLRQIIMQQTDMAEDEDAMPDIDQDLDIEDQRKKVQYDARKEVTYDIFVHQLFPKMNKSLASGYHPSLVWTEIVSFIQGSIEALHSEKGYLTLEDYQKLGRKRAPNFTADRDIVYKLYKEYRRQKQNHGYFDEADLIHNLYQRLKDCGDLGWVVHEFYVDETQDFTQAELCLLIRCCQYPNQMFLTGDTAQSIMRGIAFRFEDVRTLFYEAKQSMKALGKACPIEVPQRLYQLVHNYRSHSGILRVASSVVDLLSRFFPQSFDQMQPDQGLFEGPQPLLLESCQTSQLALMMHGQRRQTSQIEFGAHQAILVVNEEAREKLPEEFRMALKLTIFESKGLEFDDVLLYNFFKDSQAKKEWRVVTDHLNELAEERKKGDSTGTGLLALDLDILQNAKRPRPLKFDPDTHKVLNSELKHLYTALTRARVNVWIFDEDADARAPVFEYWKALKLVKLVHPGENISEAAGVGFAKASSREEWETQGQKFFKHQLYELAAQCYQYSRNRLMEKKSMAHYYALQASKLTGPPRDIRNMFLRAAREFLHCRMKEEAARCLCNARERYLAAQVYEKNGQFQHAATLYVRLGYPQDASRAYESALDYSGAVEALVNINFYDKAIDVVKRFDMKYQSYKSRDEMPPKRFVDRRPHQVTMSVSSLAKKGAAHHLKYASEDKKKEKVMMFLDYLDSPQESMEWLHQKKQYAWIIPVMEKQGKKYEIAVMLREEGQMQKALGYADKDNKPKFRAECLLAIAKVKLLSTENTSQTDVSDVVPGMDDVPKLLGDSAELFKKAGYRQGESEALLLLGKYKQDCTLIATSLKGFQEANHQIGQIHAQDALLSHPKCQLEFNKCLFLRRSLEVLFSLYTSLLPHQRSLEERKNMHQCLQFYGLEKSVDLYVVMLTEGARIQELGYKQNQINEEVACRMISSWLLDRAESWLKMMDACLTNCMYKCEQCESFAKGFVCTDQCNRLHAHYTTASWDALVKVIVLFIRVKHLIDIDGIPSTWTFKIAQLTVMQTQWLQWFQTLYEVLWPAYGHCVAGTVQGGNIYAMVDNVLHDKDMQKRLLQTIKEEWKKREAIHRQANTDLFLMIFNLQRLCALPDVLTSRFQEEESIVRTVGGLDIGMHYPRDAPDKPLCFFRLLFQADHAAHIGKPFDAVGHVCMLLSFVCKQQRLIKPIMPSIANTAELIEWALMIATYCKAKHARDSPPAIVPESYLGLVNLWDAIAPRSRGMRPLVGSVHENPAPSKWNLNGRIRTLVRILCGQSNEGFNVVNDAFMLKYVKTGEAERILVLVLFILANAAHPNVVPADNIRILRQAINQIQLPDDDESCKLWPQRLLHATRRLQVAKDRMEIIDILSELLASRNEQLLKCTWSGRSPAWKRLDSTKGIANVLYPSMNAPVMQTASSTQLAASHLEPEPMEIQNTQQSVEIQNTSVLSQVPALSEATAESEDADLAAFTMEQVQQVEEQKDTLQLQQQAEFLKALEVKTSDSAEVEPTPEEDNIWPEGRVDRTMCGICNFSFRIANTSEPEEEIWNANPDVQPAPSPSSTSNACTPQEARKAHLQDQSHRARSEHFKIFQKLCLFESVPLCDNVKVYVDKHSERSSLEETLEPVRQNLKKVNDLMQSIRDDRCWEKYTDLVQLMNILSAAWNNQKEKIKIILEEENRLEEQKQKRSDELGEDRTMLDAEDDDQEEDENAPMMDVGMEPITLGGKRKGRNRGSRNQAKKKQQGKRRK